MSRDHEAATELRKLTMETWKNCNGSRSIYPLVCAVILEGPYRSFAEEDFCSIAGSSNRGASAVSSEAMKGRVR